MDPYLEQPALWSSFHSRFIVAVANAIEQNLSAQYYVEVETRTYEDSGIEGLLVGIPDAAVVARQTPDQVAPGSVAAAPNVSTQIRPQQVILPVPVVVKERYLEVRDITNHAVITVMELLSPKNKQAGEGRDRYQKKRQAILGSATHLVELDLLRAGKPMPIVDFSSVSAYRILVSSSHQRPAADLYSLDLWQPLPELPIPLRAPQETTVVSLQSAFDEVYRQARYASRIDYSQSPPLPTLSSAEKAWLAAARET